MAGMPGSAISSRTELAVRSSLKSQLGSTSRPSAGPTQVSNRTPSSTSPPIATPFVPAILGSPVRESITATSKVPPPKSTAISTPRCVGSPITAAAGSARKVTSSKPASMAPSSSRLNASASDSRAITQVCAGKHDGMADHDASHRLAGECVGLILQPPHHDRNQRADGEVRRPGVRAGKAELRELVLYPRKQAGIVAATALAVLTAVGVPAVRRQRAIPAVGLLVPGLEERPHRLVARGTTAAAMEVDEGR